VCAVCARASRCQIMVPDALYGGRTVVHCSSPADRHTVHLGWTAVDLPLGCTSWRCSLGTRAFGMTVLMLAILRLLWRFSTAPELPPAMTPVERVLREPRTSRSMFFCSRCRYRLDDVIRQNYSVSWFGLFTARPHRTKRDGVHYSEDHPRRSQLHSVRIAVLHNPRRAQASFLDKDDVFLRMLPFTKSEETFMMRRAALTSHSSPRRRRPARGSGELYGGSGRQPSWIRRGPGGAPSSRARSASSRPPSISRPTRWQRALRRADRFEFARHDGQGPDRRCADPNIFDIAPTRRRTTFTRSFTKTAAGYSAVGR